MAKTVILFFGSSRGFENFKYDNFISDTIEFKLCTNINQSRGIEFNGYMIHHSCTYAFQQEISLSKESLDRRAELTNEKI